ncbi:AsmA family protein [Oleisolibacter albus]|uniref:AsmA family protein n=1 Tax=Oleisolibacter albus TaxID=2171757 RepID=UPI000DF43128|nr:AsmA family protein [Oleisolibacter albus]
MKKLLIGIAGLLALAGGAVLVLPGLIDWSAYRGEIAALLERATGRRVEIGGDIRLALLPTPTLSAGTLALFERDSNRPALAEIDRADLRVRLRPLLTGTVQVERLALAGAHMHALRLADGTWVLPVDPEAQDAAGIAVERLDLRDSTVEIEDRVAGRDLLLEQVEAGLEGGAGDLALEVSARAGGQALRLEAALGPASPGRSLRPLRLALTATGGGSPGPDGTAATEATATLRFAGLGSVAAPLRLDGTLEAEGTGALPLLRAGRTLLGLGEEGAAALPAGLDQPLGWRSGLTADRRLLSLDGIELTLGGSRATGSADIPLRAGVEGGSLVLSFASLDLDALAGLAPASGPWVPAPLALDLLADTAGWRGGQVRDLRLLGGLVEDRLTLDTLAATLPGGTALTMSGVVTLPVEGRSAPAFSDAALTLETADLRQTLGWLGLDVGDVPAERLRNARLTARLAGTPRALSLLDASGSLDTTGWSGTLSLERPEGGRPSARATLLADRLLLDAYRAPGAAPWPWRDWWRQLDLTLEARIGQLTLGGVQMDGLILDGTLEQGALTLRKAAVDNAAGVTARLSGRIGGLDPLGPTELGLEAEAPTLATLARALDLTLPVAPDRLGAVRLTGRLGGDAGRLDLAAEAGLLGGTAQLGGGIGDPWGEAPTLDLKLRTTLPDTADLLRLWLPGWSPAAGPGGALDLYAVLSGPLAQPALSEIQGRAFDTPVSGHLALDRRPDAPVLTGTLQAGALDLDRLMPALTRTGAPWDLGWTRRLHADLALAADGLVLAGQRLETARLRLTAADGTIGITDLAGRWNEGGVSGEARLSQPAVADGAPPPLAGEGTLAVQDAVLPPLAGAGLLPVNGRIDLTLEGRGEGGSPAALVRALTGSGTLAWREGVLSGLDLPALAFQLPALTGADALGPLLGRAVRQGATPIAQGQARFSLDQGVASSRDLRLAGPAGTIRAEGSLRLDGRVLQAHADVQLAEPAGVPAFGLTLSGPLAEPAREMQRQVQSADLSAWVGRHAAATPVSAQPPRQPAGADTPPPAKPTASRPAAPRPPARQDVPKKQPSVQDILDRLKD